MTSRTILTRGFWQRHLYRYSLRTLFLVMIIGAVLFGYIHHRLRQKEAVDRILELNGQVGYDYETDAHGGGKRNPRPPAAGWIPEEIANTFIATVVVVQLSGSEVNDTDMALVGRLSELRWLEIRDTSITDRGVAQLRHLSRLEEVVAEATMIDGSGFHHLAGSSIRRLSLPHSRVSNEGLAAIGELTKLKYLDLGYNPMIGSGCRAIVNLKKLEHLALSASQINDADLEQLSQIESLRWLAVDLTNVSEDAVLALRRKRPELVIEL